MITTVRGCARCGADHKNIDFAKLSQTPLPIDEQYQTAFGVTHWSICPVLNEPILLRVLSTLVLGDPYSSTAWLATETTDSRPHVQGWKEINENMRTVLLVEVGEENHDGLFDIEEINFAEVRSYDMKDEEQCAIQFVREMVMQGRSPDPESQRLVVIGGSRVVTANAVADDSSRTFPIENVPFRVFIPVAPPPTPTWGVNEVT